MTFHMYFTYMIHHCFNFLANSGSNALYASRTRQMAKTYFRFTRILVKWLCTRAVAAICALEKPIPLNPLWIVEHLSGIAVWEGMAWKIFETMFTFAYNYCLWKMMIAQAYCVISDIVISVLAVSFCQDVANR